MKNLLSNPSFEGITSSGAWTRATHVGIQFGEIYTPEHFVSWWDPRQYRPEMHVIELLPPYVGPPGRILDGRWAGKWQGSFNAWAGGVYQTVTGLEVGAKYVAGFAAHAWCNHDGLPNAGNPDCAPMGCGPLYYSEDQIPPENDDPINDAIGAALFQVGLQFLQPDQMPDPTYNVMWGPQAAIYNAYAQVPELELRALTDTAVVYLRAALKWDFRNNDAYVDSAYLMELEAPPPRPYERTYVLLPPDATQDEARSVLDAHFDERNTVGFSADDAGVDAPNLTRRAVIAYRPEAWPGDLEGFFETYYPGIDEYEARELPLSPPPTIDTTNRISAHLQTMIPRVREFLKTARPASVKRVTGMQDLQTIKRWAPWIETVYRHDGNPEGALQFCDPQGRVTDESLRVAGDWLARYQDSLVTVSTCGLWSHNDPFYMEGPNEFGWSAGNLEKIKRAASFERSWIIKLGQLGLPVAPVCFCAGPGNIGRPGLEEQDFLLLVDLARETAAAGGAFGLHSYWTPGKLVENWRILPGRYQWIDEILVANGVYVKWMLGEGGIAGCVDNWLPLEGAGWKHPCGHNGDWDAYLAEILEWNRRTQEWNSTHDNRCRVLNLFTTGINIGWLKFLLGSEELDSLAGALS